MATVTFSILEYLSGPQQLDLMGQYAKKLKKADPIGKPLGWHQNNLAMSLGFNNWSMLHKHLAQVKWLWQDHVLDLALKKPGLGQFLQDHAFKTIDEDEGTEIMKSWARAKYTPLIDFAFFDSEAENGFSWPEVDMVSELGDQFGGLYPQELIEEVGQRLEADGPWGLELAEHELDFG